MKNLLVTLMIVTGVLSWIGASADDALPRPRGRRVIEPFDFKGITLGPGALKRQVDEVRAFYLAIPDDDLLKGFRTRAGKPAPGKDLGGWYSSDTFLVFGQIVSGLARLHAGTGDPACRDKANHLIEEWAKCIEPDGYFYASRKPNAPHYVYDKTVWGLLDDYLYCGNREALAHLSRITDWAVKNLERSRKVNDTSTEWYTLSENLYRVYLATGDPKYRDFAEVWEYHAYWDVYARNGDIFASRPDGGHNDAYHAYSHVNTLGGAGAAYLVKGEGHYLDTLRNAYDFLQKTQCFATGGFGPDESLLPTDRLPERLQTTHNTFETQCGCWAAFKMAKYLMSFTGDARYGDWGERLVLNGIGASIPMTTDGKVFYYSDYNIHGGNKHNTDFGWSCCTGTRPQAVADYHDLIYFHDDDHLYVNLYTSSTVKWDRSKGTITVAQETSFPETDEVRLNVRTEKPTEFTLAFRSPNWLAVPMTAEVNGQPVALPVDEKHWANLKRTWNDGDTIVLRLPMKLSASPLGPGASPPTAALYGPVVLAFQAPNAKSLAHVDLTNITRTLVPDPGHPLEFHLAANPEIRARPFQTIGAQKRYFLYLGPGMGSRIPHADVKFTGTWHDAGIFRFSNEVGATAECEFEGKGARWLGQRFDDAGIAEITIDGKVVATIDQFGPGRGLPFDWSHSGLATGRHTIRLRLLPDKPEHSRDRYLNVVGFEILDAPNP